MTVPVFEEYVPAVGCGCAGCARERRMGAALPVRHGGGPRRVAYGARSALVLVTAAGVVLSCGAAEAAAASGAAGVQGSTRAPRADTADPPPDSPQGAPGPLSGAGVPESSAGGALPRTTRDDIMSRAKKWVSAKVPYSTTSYWSDGYRQDCSGYVSMAWNLGSNEWTGSLASFGTKISRSELEPGDILLFHNEADPSDGSHVTIFGGWTDSSHTSYTAYEQTPPQARKQATPMAYWTNSSKYVPYRYDGVTAATSSSASVMEFPGTGSFGPGADNEYVTRLGTLLIERGGRRFYQQGATPRWGDADQRATQAFQQAQGWEGSAADGLPGLSTWKLLVEGTGKDIPAASTGGAPGVPAYPGTGAFRPGQSSGQVEALGRQLVEKGYGAYYVTGPGPVWSEADRRNVEAFQRAQGWSGSAADGYPGPETWRRLFA